MTRSRKILTVLGATAVMALVAPPAHAQIDTVDNAAGCTTDYLDDMKGPWAVPVPATVTYTPPATVTVDASPGVNFAGAFANYTVNATVTYVDCLV